MSTTATKEKTIEDFRQEATAYMKEKKVRWSEACLAIKKKYGNAACKAFGAPEVLER